DPGYFATIVGTTGYDWLDQLAVQVGASFDAVAAERLGLETHEKLLQLELPRPGIVALLSEASAAGVGVAVASNSPGTWCEDHLERLGIRHLIGPVITVDDVARPKPYPDPYRRACEA